jgi:hypothetical protein
LFVKTYLRLRKTGPHANYAFTGLASFPQSI